MFLSQTMLQAQLSRWQAVLAELEWHRHRAAWLAAVEPFLERHSMYRAMSLWEFLTEIAVPLLRQGLAENLDQVFAGLWQAIAEHPQTREDPGFHTEILALTELSLTHVRPEYMCPEMFEGIIANNITFVARILELERIEHSWAQDRKKDLVL